MSEYQETLDYLYSQLPMYQNKGASAYKADIGNIVELCTALDNPQDSFRTVHIAGTNGKGSVTHLIASVLIAEGYKVGLYTSPHYVDFRERIKIGADYIPEEQVITFVQWYKQSGLSIDASFFEITVAMAFWYFQRENVDIAIIETGLGGRLDSTNIINPLLSVITNIGMDHMNLLGNTLQSIAKEKAGIIKSRIPVVIGKYDPVIESVFERAAQTNQSPLSYARDVISIQKEKENNNTQTYAVDGFFASPVELDIADPAPYFQENLRTALASLRLMADLTNTPYQISYTKLKYGIENFKKLTAYKGRWDVISHQPLVLLDSAHNKDGIQILLHRFRNVKESDMHFILGFVKDKNWKELLQLFPKRANYYVIQPSVRRGLPVDLLKQECLNLGIDHVHDFSLISDAYEFALDRLKPNDNLLICGSTFVVADAYHVIKL